ncbi:DDE_3 domain-containing protein [Trichonephila clavipes]|nr:DDE_3 domain-containing protein [Trichonephila clavipes]
MFKKRTFVEKVTSNLDQHLGSAVSMITVRRHLHKQNIYHRAAIPKPLVSNVNAKRFLYWCHTHKTWSIDRWKKVICSEESSFTHFPTAGRVHVWKIPAQVYDCDCLLPTVKHEGGSVTIWEAMSWFSAGSNVTLKGRIPGEKIREILTDHVHPMMQTLLHAGNRIFPNDNTSIHAEGLVQS